MVHVGVDLDKHTSQIAVLAGDGEIAQQRVPNDAARLAKFFAELPPQTPVAIEASGTWWWLVDLLEELGHQPVLSNPKQTKAIAAARLKNDRVDAERLALLLRGDLLPTVWIPPAALREARELVRHRIQLVWLRGVIRNRLQAMLARRNLHSTSGKSWLTQRAARAARVAAAALDGGAESDPRGLCRPTAVSRSRVLRCTPRRSCLSVSIEITNERPRPFVWTKTADEILASVARFCHRISNSGH